MNFMPIPYTVVLSCLRMVSAVLRRGSQTLAHHQTLSKHTNYIYPNLSPGGSDYPPALAITDIRDMEEKKIVLT